MTRTELFKRLARNGRIPKLQAELVVEAVFDCFAHALRRSERVEIRDFGTFSVRRYRGYQGRNPKTGDLVRVGPKRLPYFKPSKTLLAQLNRLLSKSAAGVGETTAATQERETFA